MNKTIDLDEQAWKIFEHGHPKCSTITLDRNRITHNEFDRTNFA